MLSWALKYPKLRCESKIATLAVKIAKEAIFGDKILVRCTVLGEQVYPGLPVQEVNELKTASFHSIGRQNTNLNPLGRLLLRGWWRSGR